ncbi:MAG: two-component sensor histidine kinase [Thermoleophilia bacterium]|nr:two-component sensor histidine kinase [Thermoleophilia bacterium]
MIGLLQRLPIQLQVSVLLLAAPMVVALLALSLAPLAVEVAMAGQDARAVRTVADAVRIAVALSAAGAAIAAWGASALLRGSIAALVGCMQEATDAVARGRFRHRIDSDRGDALGRLAQAIDVMAARLEQLEASRRRMLASVSHELRTPLTIIRGHAYTLARQEEDRPRRERFDLIDREVMRLNELVEELVDTASLLAGGVCLVKVDWHLDVVIAEVIRGFEVQAHDRDLALAVDLRTRDTAARLDIGRIQQVLDNLLANAVRHAAQGSRVEIALERSTRAHRIVVSNAGSSVSADDAERIFEPFEQGDGRTGRIGLGLAIARSLVVAHGGTLHLDAHGEPGSVSFVATLPAPPAVGRAALGRVRRRRARSSASGMLVRRVGPT